MCRLRESTERAAHSFAPRSRVRGGAAFVLLVIAVLLVVTAATQRLLRTAADVRRAEASQRRATAMQAAISAVVRAEQLTRLPIELPVDSDNSIRVESLPASESDAAGRQLRATWMRDSQPIDSLTRRIETDAASEETP